MKISDIYDLPASFVALQAFPELLTEPCATGQSHQLWATAEAILILQTVQEQTSEFIAAGDLAVGGV
jgi:hypothetical protein